MMHLNDIIIAVASPPGRSGRAIVRMSGQGSIEALSLILAEDLPRSSRGIHRGAVQFDDRRMLPALALTMPGPHSYTGEDSCELQCPGNPILLDRIISMLIDRSSALGDAIRRAEPGEFTARAYFNGRLSLDAAEGVAATISARSDAELRASHHLLEGRLGSFTTRQMHALAELLALVEAGIDFTDEDDVIAIGPADLLAGVRSIADALSAQLVHAIGTEQLEAVPWVVLAGLPNAGKSTLFNALLGRQRAVTSGIAGTTRDVLVEPLTLQTDAGPAEVMLVDLAGLDADDVSEVNRGMQQAAAEAMGRAELVIHCVTHSKAAPAIVRTDPSTVVVRTKCDLASPGERDEGDALRVSAIDGTGIEALTARIAGRLADRLVSVSADMLALQPRHEAALREASCVLADAIELIEPMKAHRTLEDPELIAALLRSALDLLGSIVGAMTPDDVLGLVFGRFCIGK